MTIGQIIRANPMTVEERASQWTVVRDCLEGDIRIKQKGTDYLPRPSGMRKSESDDPFTSYKTRAEFYGVAERTLRGLTGMVFRIEPTFTVPTVLEERLKAITPEGLSIQTLARAVIRAQLSVGRYGLLSDMPRTETTGAVPYIAAFSAENIVDWEELAEDGKRVLIRVDLRVGEEKTPWAEEKLLQSVEKILRLVLVDGVYEQHRFERKLGAIDAIGETEIIVPRVRNMTLTEIPFQFVNPYDLEPEIEKPPLYDLCRINISHYRNSADYEHTLYMTANPTPCFSGVTDVEKARVTHLGPGAIYGFGSPDAKGWFMEFTGSGAGAIREAMLDKENRMAVLGARMIREQKRAAESAEKTRLDSQDETSVVMAVVRTADDAFTKVLRTMAEWSGGNPDEVDVTFNKEFVEVVMPPDDVLKLVASWQQGAISEDVLWWNLQRGGRVPANRTLEEDKELREDEGPVARFAPVPDVAADAADEEDEDEDEDEEDVTEE